MGDVASVLTAGGALLGNIWNAYEARQNRNFQERMSSTAHQREIADLKAANINPLFRGMGGAATPGGDRAEMRDPSSALRARAELKLLDAQADRESSSARLARVQASDIETTWSSGRGDSVKFAGELAKLSFEQQRDLLPSVLARAKEEVKLTSSSARSATASAILDEAAAAGAKNLEELEKKLGPAGPAVRMLFELMRTLRGAAR